MSLDNLRHSLFVPGTMCDQRVWQPVMDLMTEVTQCHYVAIEDCQTRMAMSQKIATQVSRSAEHSAQKVNLIGFSMGGYLSLQYALEHPEHIQHLVLVCISAISLPDSELHERRQNIAWLKQHTYKGISRVRLSKFVHPSQQQNSAVVDVVKAMDKDLGQAVLIQQLEQTSERKSLLGELSNVPFPVTIIGAQDDALVAPEDLRRMAKQLEEREQPIQQYHQSLHIVPTAGHMLPLEQPNKIAEILTAQFR